MDKAKLIRDIVELQRQVNRSLRRHSIDAWMQVSLTMPQLRSLFFIVDQGETNFRKLAAALKVTPSNVTGVIDRLVEQGLVSRQENPEDRRVSVLRATDKGEILVSALRERTTIELSEFLSPLDEDELAVIARGLSLLARAAQEAKTEVVETSESR